MVSVSPVCPSCGKSNPDDVQYCQYCYSPMDPSKPSAPMTARRKKSINPDRYRITEYLLLVALFFASPIWLLVIIHADELSDRLAIGGASLVVLSSTFAYLAIVCALEPYRNREAKPSRWILTTVALVAYAAAVAVAITQLIAMGEERSHSGAFLSEITIDAIYLLLLPPHSVGVFMMTVLCMDRDSPRRIRTARYILSGLLAASPLLVIFILLATI